MNLHGSEAKQRVSILIPLFNEEESLPILRTKLAELHGTLQARYAVHYSFIDDGSTDGTARLLPAVVPAGTAFDIHRHPSNRGIGAAFRTAFRHADADVVCTIDADCSYAPAHLLGMIDAVVDGGTDVVVASPYHPEGEVEGVQPWRLALSKQCSRFYRAASQLKLYTYTSVFRAYRGSVVRELVVPSDGFVAAVEILLHAASLGYRISECPLTLRRRQAGCSKMRVFRTIQAHSRLIAQCLRPGGHGYPAFCAPSAVGTANVAAPRMAAQDGSLNTGRGTRPETGRGNAGGIARPLVPRKAKPRQVPGVLTGRLLRKSPDARLPL